MVETTPTPPPTTLGEKLLREARAEAQARGLAPGGRSSSLAADGQAATASGTRVIEDTVEISGQKVVNLNSSQTAQAQVRGASQEDLPSLLEQSIQDLRRVGTLFTSALKSLFTGR